MTRTLVVERRGDVAWLTLNRPAKRNALNPEVIDALGAAVGEAANDRAVRAIVIAGAGPSFCAGADLGYLHDCALDGRDPLEFLTRISATFTQIEHCPKPVIAAVHGHAVAGGLELALVCDTVVARAGTLIGDGHLRTGLLPAAGASARLPRRVGDPLARWLLLSGELLPAERFLPSGFVHSVLPVAGFTDGVQAIAARLAAVPATAQTRAKRLLPGADDEALATELKEFAAHWAITDIAAALRRYAS